jgi:hypothetical protein
LNVTDLLKDLADPVTSYRKAQPTKQPANKNASVEVVVANCGGFMSFENTSDEYIMGSGFKQCSEFTKPLSKEQDEYFKQFPEAPNCLRQRHLYELVCCAVQMLKNMPAIRDYYIRKYQFIDCADVSNYVTKALKLTCSDYLRQTVAHVKERLLNRKTGGGPKKDAFGFEHTGMSTPTELLTFFFDQL